MNSDSEVARRLAGRHKPGGVSTTGATVAIIERVKRLWAKSGLSWSIVIER
jgi:hypothetical protein